MDEVIPNLYHDQPRIKVDITKSYSSLDDALEANNESPLDESPTTNLFFSQCKFGLFSLYKFYSSCCY